MDRPTFHESWHRVAEMRPRLRASVRMARQHFRGQRWHVVEDPASGLFYRMNDAAYDFIARLDGKQTVAAAWKATVERLGDDSVTQGEAIGLLGQLWQSNLVWADVPADTKAMFQRKQERQVREWRGYMSSLLFLRIRLLDPDAFLNRWAPLTAWVWTWFGAALWLALVAVGAWHLAGRSDALITGTQNVLAGENLLPLYATYAIIKALHELGHAVSCKVFGLRSGRGGEVHAIGVMLMIFLPIPYVDATSSWGLRSKLQRIVVASAGMIVETACAAVAAIVWARTAEGSVANSIAYNVIFLASVSTLLFNGNPLLRYDGYYIFSDLIGVANLAGRSQEYLRYLVKKFAWGIRGINNPAHDRTEGFWLFFYGVASAIYRVFIYAAMALFIASQQFLIGGALLLFGAAVWILAPAGKLIHYLARSHELDRTRPRAILTAALTAAALVLPLALIPADDHARAEGIAEPASFEVIHARADGFIESATTSGSEVSPGADTPLIVQRNDELIRRRESLEAEAERLRVTRALAFRDDPAKAMQIDRQIVALEEQRRWTESEIASLRIVPTIAGSWIAPELDRMRGAFVERGRPLGLVADLSAMRVRAVLSQRAAAIVIDEGEPNADLRARMRPEQRFSARVEQVIPGGQKRLPSAALGVASGGDTPTSADDREGVEVAEEVFEAWLALPPDHGLLPGQRVEVRFTLSPRPLLMQWWRSLRQVLQERFNI